MPVPRLPASLASPYLFLAAQVGRGSPAPGCVSGGGEGQLPPPKPREAGSISAAASRGYVCRLPGSSVPRGTSNSEPPGLVAPRKGALARKL